MGREGGILLIASFTFVVLRQSVPLALAALGGVISERVGVINIALEGLMLTGAFVGMWVGQDYGPVIGLVAAVVCGGSVGVLHVTLTQRFRMNHIISGVAINILALQTTTYLLRRLFNQATPQREASVATLPYGWFVAGTAVLLLLSHCLLYRTSVGLRMRAVGESAESARMAGVNPGTMRFLGVTLSGMLGGLAGAYLSLSQVGRFSDDMVSGRGFIALAAVICGRWTPIGAVAAAVAFGLFDALQIQMQGTVKLPGEALRSLPYILTILTAMLLRPIPPADLGKTDGSEQD